MYIEVRCNGFINSKGMDFQDLRLSLRTEGIDNIKFVEYEFYEAEEKVKNGEFFHKEKCIDGFCNAKFDKFKCGDCIFYRAVLHCEDNTYVSNVYSVECGLTENAVAGQWIENPNFDGRVAEFLKEFSIEEDVVRARLYIVGLGFYESKINGVATDEYYFKPIFTDFDVRKNLRNNPWYDEENFANGKKTVCYDTFDVTGLLKKGENNLRVVLGTGWYCDTDKDFVDPSFAYGTPKLFFELHIECETTAKVIFSDESCLVRNTALKSQMFAGDYWDLTKADEPFEVAKPCPPPTGKLTPSIVEKDAVIERIQPIEIKKERNKLLYDFGKNHTGGLKLQIKGNRGDKVKIQYYEVLSSDGTPNPYTSRWLAYEGGKYLVSHIDQQGEYILSGNVDEIRPLFHWNCYRFAEIELPTGCELISVESLFIATELAQDGAFRCSFKILNDLYKAFVLTQRDNMHCGVPSDCPHREKLPYTGDGQLVAEAAMYAFDAETFYRKWLNDIVDSQGANGWIPYTAPNVGGGGGYWWCNALPVLSLTLYRLTGDKRVLRQALQPSLRLVAYYDQMHEGDYVIRKTCTEWLLGDWLAPDAIASDISYINTFAFYSAVTQTKEIAEYLSDVETALKMQTLQEKLKDAINKRFFDVEKLQYGNGQQGENVLPFVYEIVPQEYEEKLWRKVVSHYKTTKCLDTGIVLTPMLLEELVKRNETELAIELMTQTKYPSFAYMLENETTLCEHWSKYWPKTKSAADSEDSALEGDVSHCHPMFGSVVAWMYKHVAGLDLSKVYKKKITFAPKFIHTVYEASAQKMTAFGLAAIKYDACGTLKMQIRVPHGMEGEVRIPIAICETFYVNGTNGQQVKSRKRGEHTYVKLSGGDWMISSDVSFGK